MPVQEHLLAMAGWMREAGVAGFLAYAAVYVLATILLLPGSVLTAAAGFAYGPVAGTLLVSPLSVMAAVAAFAVGRTIARPGLERRLAANRRFQAISRAVGERGFTLVTLLRLSPILPYTLLNYGLGLTRVRLVTYVAASWIGMLPGTLLYVYAGSAITRASELASGESQASGLQQLLFAAGLVATVTAAVLLGRAARRALDAIETSRESPC